MLQNAPVVFTGCTTPTAATTCHAVPTVRPWKDLAGCTHRRKYSASTGKILLHQPVVQRVTTTVQSICIGTRVTGWSGFHTFSSLIRKKRPFLSDLIWWCSYSTPKTRVRMKPTKTSRFPFQTYIFWWCHTYVIQNPGKNNNKASTNNYHCK